MVKIRCKKCGTVGYTASPWLKCKCGNKFSKYPAIIAGKNKFIDQA